MHLSNAPTIAPPAVSASNLVMEFGGRRGVARVRVLENVGLAVPAGQMVAVVGPSGCGKSTLLFALAGLDRPTSGQVSVLGNDLGRMSRAGVARLYRDRIGFVFQTYNLVPSLPARENVVLPQRLAHRKVDFAGADSALEAVGMSRRHADVTAKLSSGEQQRTALARVLLKNPAVVFADEPTGALDTVTANLVLAQLRALADGQRTVVMVTHDLQAASLADTVLVMRDGAIHYALDRSTPEQILEAMNAAPARPAA